MDLAEKASRARAVGEFERAIELYAAAEEQASSVSQRLHLAMRRAYCLIDLGQLEAAAEIGHLVVGEGRANEVIPELCDALGLLVDDHMLNNRVAEATDLLAEARYLIDQLDDDPSIFQVVHNLGVTFERCDFPATSLEIFERALRLAADSNDRAYVLCGMAASHHLAMLNEPDETLRDQHIDSGLLVTTEVIESTEPKEIASDAAAYGHRAWFFNARGRHAEALADALEAGRMASAARLSNELVVALLAEAVARWSLHRDLVCLDLIEQAWELAEGPWIRRFPAAVTAVHVDALWHHGRYDEARDVMQRQRALVDASLRRERSARLAHVELGVAHREIEQISETDPLTGLYNRRYLAQILPIALERFRPVCVAVFDLDGFKLINDRHSYDLGDHVLQQVAEVLRDSCRSGDCVIRLGGDEFVMVLAEILPDDARIVLERVRERIVATRWDGLPPGFALTTSVGVAVGTSIAHAHHVVTEASAAMQAAKRAGRDQIVFA